MGRVVSGEKRASDLSTVRSWLLIVLVSIGSVTVYAPAYLKAVFYDAQLVSLNITETQSGQLLSAFAITAVICYLPSGLVADRMRMRDLSTIGFVLTAGLTFWYATLPTNFTVLIVIFVGMGISTILLWWGVRYKLVRLVSPEKDYPRNIGISYAIYGFAGLLIMLAGLWIANPYKDVDGNMADPQTPFRIFLLLIAGILLVLGILSFVFIPKFEGELTTANNAKDVILGAIKSLVNPVVLICAATMFFVYFFYTGINYTTGFLSNVLGASDSATTLFGAFRTYGTTIVAGPIFGLLAGRSKSPSKVIAAGSALVVIGCAALALLPQDSGMIAAIIALGIGMGFLCNGIFSQVSGQLTEGKVPVAVFGAATGVISVVGFLPDTFSSTWFGSMLDQYIKGPEQGDAYSQIFWILGASAAIAIGCALVLIWYVKHNKAKLDAVYDAAVLQAAAQAEKDLATA